jgi:ABC-type amino acid transport substrate-binding protein
MRLRIGLCLLMLVLLLPFTALAQDALPDLGGATITVSVENAYPPFNFIDEATGEGKGWDYDAINEICARLNCVPEYIETPWDGMLLAMANGEFDVAADGITITEERDQTVDFSIGYVSTEIVLLARADEERFTSIDEFAANPDLVLSTQTGTTNYQSAIDLVGEERILAFDLFPTAVQAVLAGDADAVIIDSTAGLGYQGENADQLAIIDGTLSSDALGFVFPEGSELRDAFNAALTAMTDDGTLATLNAKWFGLSSVQLDGATITVAVENAYPPFNFIDEATGEPAGWDYDAINEICARLNCVPEYIETAWDGMLLAIANGDFDVAADGITITEERDQTVDFSIGYVSTEIVLLARADEDRFTSIDEFVANSELVLSTQTGTTNYETALGLVGEERILAFDLFPTAVQAVLAGDADAVIIDSTAGLGYQGENADQLAIIDGTLSSDALGFVFPEGSELRAAFDAALMTMMADGSLQAINEKWFSAE